MLGESENFCLWNPESAKKNLLVEPEILGFGIRITVQEIRNPTNDWIQYPGSTDKDENPVPEMRNPPRGIHNPRLPWTTLQCTGI